jgi:hypothetical protein
MLACGGRDFFPLHQVMLFEKTSAIASMIRNYNYVQISALRMPAKRAVVKAEIFPLTVPRKRCLLYKRNTVIVF